MSQFLHCNLFFFFFNGMLVLQVLQCLLHSSFNVLPLFCARHQYYLMSSNKRVYYCHLLIASH